MNDMEKKAQELMDRIGMMRNLGTRIVEITRETATLAFTGGDNHCNYRGMLHGGAIATILDTVGFMPGDLLPSGRILTTEGMEVHYFRPAEIGEEVSAKATILRNGRRVVTVQTEAFDSKGKKIAHAVVTLLDVET